MEQEQQEVAQLVTIRLGSEQISPPGSAPTHVVGIGASAGGLEALEAFFAHMPLQSDLAFVVVQHLSPDFKSLMDQLLARHTQMAIVRVEGDTPVAANTIYLIPPRKDMIIVEGTLRLTDQTSSSRGVHLPIDTFFASLAEDVGERAIAVVLSGTGSDGTRGIRAIKEHGGVVFVQHAETAKFDGMPRSALATGLADHVLPPDRMPNALLTYVQCPLLDREPHEEPFSEEDGFAEIISLLQQEYDIDFSHYKRATLTRRIYRRMGIAGITDINDFISELRTSSQERRTILRDLLIGVTHFFRDRDAFAALEYEIIPTIVQRASPGSSIRVWIAACSTGEEAYSLAMLFREQLEREKKRVEVKIFATDIDKEAVEFAASGIYPESIATDVPTERLQHFFTHKGDTYQVNRNLREMVIFAPHDLTKDPPFTKMDMVSCRNCLIYIDQPMQQRVLARLSYALLQQGFLFLGPSESLGEIGEAFQIVNGKWKVYRKTRDVRLSALLHGVLPPMGLPSSQKGAAIQADVLQRHTEATPLLAYASIVEDYSPPALVVNEQREVLWIVGDAAVYLQMPAGRVSTDVLRIICAELSVPVAVALRKIVQEKTDLVYSGVQVHVGEEVRRLRLRLKWVSEAKTRINLIIIFFEAEQPVTPLVAEERFFDPESHAVQRILDLEQELQRSQENLQATIEELETSNEELQSANEELMAANEELQSTNEELYSVNEELYTVNAEFQSKIQELIVVNNDMDNLLRSTDIGTIFLDQDLHVRKFTPAATEFVPLLPHDIGRPIAHLSHVFVSLDLQQYAETVLRTGKRTEREVRTPAGTWLLLRLSPFLTEEKICTGVVLSFIDITANKETEQNLALHVRQLEILRVVATQITQELDLTVLLHLLIRRAMELIEVAEIGVLYLWDEATQTLMPQAWHNVGDWIRDVRLRLDEGVVGTVAQRRQGLVVDDYDQTSYASALFKEHLKQTAVTAEPLLYRERLIGVIFMSTTAPGRHFTPQDCELLALFASQAAIAIANAQLFAEAQAKTTSLTETNAVLQQEIEERQRAEERVRLTVESSPHAMVMVNHTGHIVLANSQTERYFGYPRDELLGQSIEILLPERFRQQHPLDRARFMAAPTARPMGAGRDLYGLRKDGTEFPIEIGLSPIDTDEGLLVLSAIIDITERKQVEAALRESEERFRLMVDAAPVLVWMAGPDALYTFFNKSWLAFTGRTMAQEMGDSWTAGVHINDLPYYLETYRAAFDARQPFTLEYRLRRADGVYRWLLDTGAPRFTADGSFLGYIGSCIDITDHKQTAETLQHSIAELERCNKELDDYTHVVSHDLKAPLRAISNLATWITEDAYETLPEASRQDLVSLQRRAQRMENLLDDLLQYSRIGRIGVETDVIQVGDFIRSIVDELRPPENFQVNVVAEMPTLTTPKAPLEQVLHHLIGNAIKHHDRSDGCVDISARSTDAWIEFMVTDDGPGIPPEFHQRIFQPFETLQPRDKVEGNGMGLAIVQKIVERYGGTINIASAPGQGTTFRFTWPHY